MLPRRLTACLMIATFAVAVASCAKPGPLVFPPAEDLRVEPKPKPGLEVLFSREAGERHDNAVEAWGEALAAQVARQCRFWRAQGMPLPFDCPEPEKEPEPQTPSQDARPGLSGHDGERR